MKRITIARDGTVKLRGKSTRWTCVGETWCGWVVTQPGGTSAQFQTRHGACIYLDCFTDEELMG